MPHPLRPLAIILLKFSDLVFVVTIAADHQWALVALFNTCSHYTSHVKQKRQPLCTFDSSISRISIL